MEDFVIFNELSPAAVQLTNFSDSPQWIPEVVALMKIFEAEEFSEDSLLAAKTTEDLDFTKSIYQNYRYLIDSYPDFVGIRTLNICLYSPALLPLHQVAVP